MDYYDVTTSDVMLSRAKEIAYVKHMHQTDLLGQPYYLHPVMVVKLLAEDAETNKTDILIVGYLHDIVEDTKTSLYDLSALGFTHEIVEAIEAMTRGEEEKYTDYIVSLSHNEIARLVKMADLRHNTDIRRIKYSTDTNKKDSYRIMKYIRAFQFLSGKMTEQEYRG
jgi:(p)ppGpp synthase/HD superfamily hydrolase